MKSIVSFNIPTHDFTFDRAITFYFICRNHNHSLYLYKNDQTCKIERVTELITFLLTSEDERVLTVVEGPDAKNIMKQLISYMYSNRTRPHYFEGYASAH
jgi:phosphotransferase system HPr-like phosphotransfer protein